MSKNKECNSHNQLKPENYCTYGHSLCTYISKRKIRPVLAGYIIFMEKLVEREKAEGDKCLKRKQT